MKKEVEDSLRAFAQMQNGPHPAFGFGAIHS
jgi:hypothetical protein